MRDSPLISVIIPVYNAEEYLNDCLESVTNQTYTNLEIIIINDGSTDQSAGFCEKWQNNDSRINVIHKKNGGQASARNIGLRYAKGEYIGFVDSDDKIVPEMYENLLELCKQYDTSLSCSRFDTFGEDHQWVIKPDTGKVELISAHDMIEIMIWPWAAGDKYATFSVWDRLYRRDILRGLYFPEGQIYEDIPFSVQAILAAKNCAYINKSLYHYRVRDNSTTGKDAQEKKRWLSDKYPIEKDQIKILQDYGYNDLATMYKYNALRDLYILKCQSTEFTTKKEIDAAIKGLNLSLMEPIISLKDNGIKIKLKTAMKVFLLKHLAQRNIKVNIS